MLKITFEQLQLLLNQQKRLVIDRLSSSTCTYNKESTESNLKNLPIDKDKFSEVGMSADFPNDFKVLMRYLSENI